uniref:Type-4 ice-structuring protein LS-12-like n=1 Tax=Lepisosteus oculatus TaxID=7918 RepID=W5LWM3_LEPOC|nr:PREDICTED: type-4 ice-structuring protein LS-12-like [Lepisosteus oculatus]
MKFFLVSALAVVLALTHGTEALSLVKREAPPSLPDFERLTKYFQDLSATLTSGTQDLVEKLKAQELTNKAQAYLEDSKAQLQPLAENIQAQLKPLVDNIEEQLRPLTDNLQSQLKPLAENAQVQLLELWKKFLDQAKALAPAPQQ